MYNELIDVNKIDISKILGNIEVKTHDSENVIVKTTNEDKVKIKCVGETLYITTKVDENNKQSFKGSNITINGNHFSGSGIIIQNGNVIVNGDISGTVTTAISVEMEIYVPKNMIKLIDVSGQVNLTIKNISESLEIDNSGQTKVNIQDIASVTLDTSGQSSVAIHNVEELDLDISGQSNVNISSDEISELRIDVSGMSNIKTNASLISELYADISGMSKLITSGKVLNKTINKSGMSEVIFE